MIFDTIAVMENFQAKLQASGLKITPQRTIIADIISRFGHIDIDQLFIETKKVLHNISLATLYKNIKLLQEKQLLREVSIDGFKTKYELNLSEHSHLICESCGLVTDIECPLPKEFAQSSQQFEVRRSSIMLYGICHNCKQHKS